MGNFRRLSGLGRERHTVAVTISLRQRFATGYEFIPQHGDVLQWTGAE